MSQMDKNDPTSDSDAALTVTSLWQRSVTIWTAALILSLGTLAIIWLTARPLALFLLGITVAAALGPIVDWLEKRLPRLAAVLVVYAVIVLFLVILIVIATPTIIQQAEALSEQLPVLIDEVTEWIDQNDLVNGASLEGVLSQAGEIGAMILSLPLMLFSALMEIFVIFIISLYLLLDAKGIKQLGASLFPPHRRQNVVDVASEMLQAAGGYVRGAAIDIFIVGTIMSIGLTIIGVNFAVILGIFAGLMELFPIVGPIIGSIPILIMAFIQSPTTGLIALIFVLVVQAFEGNVLVPNIMHRQAHVPPYVVLFALLAGGSIGGVLGAVVSIPLAAALRIFVLRVVVPEIKKHTYDTQPEQSA